MTELSLCCPATNIVLIKQRLHNSSAERDRGLQNPTGTSNSNTSRSPRSTRINSPGLNYLLHRKITKALLFRVALM